ncbi:hypothetical protein BGZ98_000391 [Dissophora globulifera]|nr:hypothetical protein BGZ98_000391 [Dissophora globulifera]
MNSQRRRVRFDNSATWRTSAKSGDSQSREFGTGGTRVDDSEDREVDDESEVESSDDDSEEGSSSSESNTKGFHSQMSLLTFTGSIRTYSLGTGSGSARSRPRINPRASRAAPWPPRRRGKSKRLLDTGDTLVQHQEEQQRKRTRKDLSAYDEADEDQVDEDLADTTTGASGDSDQDYQEDHDKDQSQDLDQDQDQDQGQDQGEDEVEAEDNWWLSRLENSEYPEDQNFVSMTTEELIGALTSGYNSDVDDEDDDEDEYDDLF